MKVLRKTGKYLKTQSQIYRGISVVSLFICFILILTSHHLSPLYIDPSTYGFLRGVLSMFFFVLAMITHYFYRTYKKGFDGEQKVSDYLESKLSDDYHLINDVKRLDGSANIDHIILAQSGIFVLETKNNSGKVFFNGNNWSYGWSPVSQVRGNAWAVYEMILKSEVLKKWELGGVQGIVVFPSAEITYKVAPQNPVLTLTDVPSYLLRNNEKRYSFEQIKEIEKVILDISNQTDLNEESFTQSVVSIIKDLFI